LETIFLIKNVVASWKTTRFRQKSVTTVYTKYFYDDSTPLPSVKDHPVDWTLHKRLRASDGQFWLYRTSRGQALWTRIWWFQSDVKCK